MSAELSELDAPFLSEKYGPKFFLIHFWTFIICEEQKKFKNDEQGFKHIHKSQKAFIRNIVKVWQKRGQILDETYF